MMRDYPKNSKLKDGRTVTLRPLESGDFAKLHAFFQALPEEDRLFLRHDVCDPDLIRKWCEKIDYERVIPLIAEEDGRIVADGTLHMTAHGWTRHMGLIRLATARSHRHVGLGTLTARELVSLAQHCDIEKLQAQIIEDDRGSLMMFRGLGFEKAAVLKDAVKDLRGRERNLAIMINDVASLSRLMEDWFQDTMVPAYRVPGGGV